MTELIKKSDFIAEIKNTMPQGTSRGVFLALIDDAPTTTEAKIRAKAIDEFAEKLKSNCDWFCAFTSTSKFCEVINELAEQLKEE